MPGSDGRAPDKAPLLGDKSADLHGKHTDLYGKHVHVHGISCLVYVFLWWVGWFFACLAGVPCSWLVGFLWVRMTLYSSFFMTFDIHSVFVLIGDVDSDYFPGKLTCFHLKMGGSLEMEMFSPFSGFLAVALDFTEGTVVS